MAGALAKFISAIVMACAVFFGIIFLAAVGGAAFGAFGGWVVGLIYPNTIRAGLVAFHIGALEPWQLGCFLGFVGGFFKATLSSPSKKSEA